MEVFREKGQPIAAKRFSVMLGGREESVIGRRIAWGWAVAAVLAVSGSALAQESPLDERARLHFESGSSYFDAGNYTRALEEFQTAYEMSGRPELLYNIYLAHERLGNLEQASANLERFLAEADIDAERRAVLETRLANIRARMTEAGATTPETTPPADTTPADTTPADTTPTPAPLPPPRGSDDGGVSTPALLAFIAAGAGLVMAGVFGTLALTEHSSLEGDDGCAPACTDDDVSSLRTYNTIADVSLGVAVIGAVVGSILIATSGGAGGESAAGAWLAPDGGGITLRGAL